MSRYFVPMDEPVLHLGQSYMGFLSFLICVMQGLYLNIFYPKFVKAYKKQPNRLDIKQFG